MEKFQGEMKIISPSGQPEILLLDVWTADNQKGIADPSETCLEDGQMKIAVYFEKAIDGGRVFPTFLPIESLCFSVADGKIIKEVLAKKILRGGIHFWMKECEYADSQHAERKKIKKPRLMVIKKIIHIFNFLIEPNLTKNKKFQGLKLSDIARGKINEAYN